MIVSSSELAHILRPVKMMAVKCAILREVLFMMPPRPCSVAYDITPNMNGEAPYIDVYARDEIESELNAGGYLFMELRP